MSIEIYLILGAGGVVAWFLFKLNRTQRALEKERAEHRITKLNHDREARQKSLDIKKKVVQDETEEAIKGAEEFVKKYRDYIDPNTLTELESAIRRFKNGSSGAV